MVVSGQINQIVFAQSVEPLQPLHGFHFSERVQGAVFGIAFVHRTGLGEGKEACPEFVFAPLTGCFQSRGVHFVPRLLTLLKEPVWCVSDCQGNDSCISDGDVSCRRRYADNHAGGIPHCGRQPALAAVIWFNQFFHRDSLTPFTLAREAMRLVDTEHFPATGTRPPGLFAPDKTLYP